MDRLFCFSLPANDSPVADPGDRGLFSENVYNRGAIALHELRKEIGDETFFSTLRAYTQRFRDQNVTTNDFVGVLNEVSGRDMTSFIDKWVHQPALPAWT